LALTFIVLTAELLSASAEITQVQENSFSGGPPLR